MKLYHGTTKLWLADILKNGICPSPNNAWQVKSTIGFGVLRNHEKAGYVYLTKTLSHAKMFADSKTEYLALKPGMKLREYFLTKEDNAPVIHTSPVVLQVSLPEGFRLIRDQKDMNFESYKYKGVIPPSCITVLS